MSAATRVAAIRTGWSTAISLLPSAGVTSHAEITNAVQRITTDNIGDQVAGAFVYDAVDALLRLFVAYDSKLNAIDVQRVPWAKQGRAVLTEVKAALDGGV